MGMSAAQALPPSSAGGAGFVGFSFQGGVSSSPRENSRIPEFPKSEFPERAGRVANSRIPEFPKSEFPERLGAGAGGSSLNIDASDSGAGSDSGSLATLGGGSSRIRVAGVSTGGTELGAEGKVA